MSASPNISKNRMKFSDEENKVLVKDFSAISDSDVLNNAKQSLGDNALTAKQTAKEALVGLQDSMGKVTTALNSGTAAADMLKSIQSNVSSKLPDLRGVSTTISGVVGSAPQYASSLSQSVTGTINNALTQVPGVIGNVEQVSTGVKADLLKSSVGEFTSNLGSVPAGAMCSASNLLNSASRLKTGIGQATRSIDAAKQSFTDSAAETLSFSATRVNSSQSVSKVSLPKSNRQALSERISGTLNDGAGKPVPESGTTSALPPASSPSGKIGEVSSPPPDISYNGSALALIFAGITWYRSLYTYMTVQRQSAMDQNFGTSDDHYAALSQKGTDLQTEQLRNFESLVSSNTPDNPNKNLYVYYRYQGVVSSLISELPTLIGSSRIQAVLAYLGQMLSTAPIKPLMTSEDYDSVSASVASIVYSVRTNGSRLTPSTDYLDAYRDAFAQLVTDAVVHHRGAPADIHKRQEASSEICVFCGVWLMRSLLQAYIDTPNVTERSQLVLGLQAVSSTQLKSLAYLYTDAHGLVREGELAYWRPTSEATTALTFPLIKHYLSHRKDLAEASSYLASNQEKAVFDAVVLRLDALIDSGIPAIEQIRDDNESITYLSLSQYHSDCGGALTFAMLDDRRLVSEASSFPERSFEMYYTTPDHLYFDADVALMR